MKTPIRRLEGITYWVIEDPQGIYDFINTEIRKEWEADARSENRNPQEDQWLKTLPQREWRLEIADTPSIKLNPHLMNYVDKKRGYIFTKELTKRSEELQREIETFGLVIWPAIVRKEDLMLADGYCRYTALKAMNIKRIYAYAGGL